MDNVFEIILTAIMVVVFLLPVIVALVVATFAANLFSALFKPITERIQDRMEELSEILPNPLDKIPSFPTIKQFFGSTKNILFICFVIVFLIFHYRTLGNVDILFENISLLFPGTALEQVVTYGTYDGTLDISSFFVNPESYLQEILFSFIAGLFMHIGCTTKNPDAKIHVLVKLLYTMLISLFSSIVLGMLPSDVFHISFPELSLDFTSVGAVTGDSDILMLLAELQRWGGILLQKLVSIIPIIVAVYFLCDSISGFAASFLGGFVAICAVAIGWPDGFSDPDSFQTVFLLLFILATGEVIALSLSEFVDQAAEGWASENAEVLAYYNIVTLLIAYFFYPALVMSVLSFISILVNGFDIAVLVFCLACLLVFSLATFAGYKITQWTSKDCSISGTNYAAAMIFNIPIWIIYIAFFAV